MEGYDKQRSYSPPNNGPTSPPVTPGSSSQFKFPSASSQTSPNYKRMGFSMLAYSPPQDYVEPVEQGHQFPFTRPQMRDPSSHSSIVTEPAPEYISETSETSDSSDESGDSDDEHPPANGPQKIISLRRTVEEADFVLEELESGSELHDESEIVRPDNVDESENELDTEEKQEVNHHISQAFAKLGCGTGSDSEDEQKRRYRQKKKRWSAGLYKRSHSQSVEGDSDVEDADMIDAHGVGSSARRLRRRTRGPADRSSLIFEDLPHNYLAEVDEPEDSAMQRGPPSLPSDAEDFTLDAMPFWRLEDPMVIDSNAASSCSSDSESDD